MTKQNLTPRQIRIGRFKTAIADILSWVPLINRIGLMAPRRWVRETYTPFAREQRLRLFLAIVRFAHINRPIEGYYMEFGSHEGKSMRMAWDCFRHLTDWSYIAFDSFEGLPEIEEIDRQEIWKKGRLKTSEEHFQEIVLGHGMPRDKLRTVKGFYDESLTDGLRDELLPTKAAVVYVDCDLYTSTVPVLEFIRPFLQRGTIIVFDDWMCFLGDPDKGERKAWAEFRQRYPEMRFEPFYATSEVQSFICISPGDA
jgi:O-methyltransferase